MKLLKKITFRKDSFKSSYLTGWEVLQNSYGLLIKDKIINEIMLPYPEDIVIADDSDDHRIRRGFMRYKKVNLLDISGSRFITGIGESYGSYPARVFKNDIIALKADSNLSDKGLTKMIEQESIRQFGLRIGLISSLIYSTEDGDLLIGSTSLLANAEYKEKMMEALKSNIPNIEFMPKARNSDIVTLLFKDMQSENIQHLYTDSKKLYKPELSDFIAKSMERVLMESRD